ncbi:MAG: MFS transporter, partial [Acidocella sp.]|nr:MFS transporter [Acidocella sp.]
MPWADHFGWSRGLIPGAIATGILLYGATGPFAAAFMQRFGIRRVLVCALVLMALSTFASRFMN